MIVVHWDEIIGYFTIEQSEFVVAPFFLKIHGNMVNYQEEMKWGNKIEVKSARSYVMSLRQHDLIFTTRTSQMLFPRNNQLSFNKLH